MKIQAHATAQEMLNTASNRFPKSNLLRTLDAFEIDTLDSFERNIEGVLDFNAFGQFEETSAADDISHLRELLTEFRETNLAVRRKAIIRDIMNVFHM
jgi:hypothetical protein